MCHLYVFRLADAALVFVPHAVGATMIHALSFLSQFASRDSSQDLLSGVEDGGPYVGQKLELQYEDAVQNFRGYLGSLRAAKARAWRTQDSLDPTKASYQILGPSSLPASLLEQPLQLNGRAAERLTMLSAQVLCTLVAYVHHELSNLELGENGGSFSSSVVRRLVVGLSGGPDSTLVLVLAAALKQLFGYEVLAVHCIHGLDPDDAIWLNHNQELCAALQVELQTPQLNIVYGEGRSPEEVSRAERYRALLSALDSSSCLLLGHQADDQVENMLLSLKRGAGPLGLSGMRFLTRDERGILLRPLLLLHKSEIEQILVQLEIGYVHDLSNNYLKFERNFMRLKILPLLRERFAGIDKAIARTQQLCSYEHNLAERLVQEKLPAYLSTRVYGAEGYSFDFAHLDLSDKPLVFMLLRAWIYKSLGFNAELNALEHCYELMLKDHDRNGEVRLSPSPYVASTFLHYLCLYSPVELEPDAVPEMVPDAELESLGAGAASLEVEAGASSASMVVPAVLRASWRLGPMRYHLLGLESDPRVPFAHRRYAPDAESSFVARLPSGRGFALRSESCFELSCGSSVALCFDYSQKLKLKPRRRAHSRELKKLLLEYEVAPWLRRFLPVVCEASGRVLTFAGLWAQDEKVQVSLSSDVLGSVGCRVESSSERERAEGRALLVLAVERVEE